MAKKRGVKSVERTKYREYQRVATHFFDAAKDSIEQKTRVSYLGEMISPSNTRELWKRLERFQEWALSILTR